MSEVRKFPIVEYNEAGLETYREEENGYWVKREYDESGRQTYWETSNGDWAKHAFDEAGREIFCENSDGFWFKAAYNENGFRTHYKDSTGKVFPPKGYAVVDDVLREASEVRQKESWARTMEQDRVL